MPRLSIVIPCLGNAAEFDDTLVSVLQNRPPRCEVLVVHAQPYDDPYDLAGEVNFLRVSGKPSLVQLLNRGLAAATADIVHVLGCHTTVVEGWTEAALRQFASADVAAVSPLVVSQADQQIVSAGVKYGLGGSRKVIGSGCDLQSRRLSQLQVSGPTLSAGFYRREVLLALGGWCPVMGDAAADVDLAQSLAALELKTAVATDCHVLERVPEPRRGGFSHGRALERLFWRQNKLRSHRALAVGLHALAVGVDFLARIPKGDAVTTLIGRLVGLLHAGPKSDYAAHLEEARALLAGEEPSTLSLDEAREERDEAPTPRRRAA